MIECLTFVVLILGFIVAGLTFLHAYRPYVGIINLSPVINSNNTKIEVDVKICNAGNVPAYNVIALSSWSSQEDKVELTELKSSFILLPRQTTSGKPKVESTDPIPLEKLFLEVTVEYSAAPLLFNWIPRHFRIHAKYCFDECKILRPCGEVQNRYIFKRTLFIA